MSSLRYRNTLRIICLALFAMLSVYCGKQTAQAEEKSKTDPDVLASEFLVDYSGVRYHKSQDRITRVYGRAFGGGDSPEQAAQTFVETHIGMFGIQPTDLHAKSNLHDERHVQPLMYNRETGEYKFTLVYFTQHMNGVPVFRADLRLLTRNEPGHPLVLAAANLKDLGTFTATPIPGDSEDDQLGRAAAKEAHPGLINFTRTERVIWAGVDDMIVESAVAYVFTGDNRGAVDATQPEHWLFVADAVDGTILHSESLILHTDVIGNVSGNASEGPGADFCEPEVLTPMPYARVNIEGTQAFADENGDFVISNGGSSPVIVQSPIRGQRFVVYNAAGADTVLSMSVTPPGPANFVHNAANSSELTRAEVNAYVQANMVRDWIVAANPSYPLIGSQTNFPVYVNRSDGYCPGNAWYDPTADSINFCTSGGGYPNTAWSSVVHHEYGHHLVSAGGSGQGAYGEGMGDVMSVIILDDSRLGVGFFGSCSGWLRDANNNCQYLASGCSSCGSAIHTCGQLISGCVWDTRNELISTEPANYQQILMDLAVNAVLVHSGSSITPQITTDWLTLDDDNGDLSDGTPHWVEIMTGFGAHNMAPPIPMGACCSCTGSEQTCEIMTQLDCNAISGAEYLGNGVECFNSGSILDSAPGLPLDDPPGSNLIVSDTITVGSSFVIVDLNVDLTIDHTWLGDLCVELEHNGEQVTLIQRPGETNLLCNNSGCCGCSLDNYAGVILDDEGASGYINNACANNISGSYIPEQALSAFDGVDPAGDWTLTVSDHYAAVDGGVFESWSLHFTDDSESNCDPAQCGCTDDPDCDDQDACTTNQCIEGQCVFTDIVCDDQDACTTDQCVDGQCVFTDVVCDDQDACTTDQCVDGQCVFTELVCDDQDACTTDQCVDGQCVFTGMVCDDQDACTADQCVDGQCVFTDMVCDDQDACTTDECVGGQCVFTDMACDDQDACTTDQCVDGQCMFTDIVCDDQDACTTDQCVDGQCVFTDIVCDDQNACTTDQCVDGQCVFTNIVCDDQDACTTGQCIDGQCVFTDIVCDDQNACTTDQCVDGECVFTDIVCNDQDACTTDQCVDGQCVFTDIVCNDQDACTTDQCIDGQCVFTNIDCDDDDACTTDTCDPQGGCMYELIVCDDDDDCTIDSCDSASGCVFVPVDCDDGDACTENVCDFDAGGCVSTPIDCNDDDACTEDSCDPEFGCVNTPLDCDDTDVCTEDSCDPVTGCAHVAIDCEDEDLCTMDTCDPVTGCTYEPVECPVGSVCDPATGQCFGTCAADLDGDGDVDAGDLAILLGSWGPNPGHPADFNGDGVVNAADLALLLGTWGPCV